jgi:hypothetical protein
VAKLVSPFDPGAKGRKLVVSPTMLYYVALQSYRCTCFWYKTGFSSTVETAQPPRVELLDGNVMGKSQLFVKSVSGQNNFALQIVAVSWCFRSFPFAWNFCSHVSPLFRRSPQRFLFAPHPQSFPPSRSG